MFLSSGQFRNFLILLFFGFATGYISDAFTFFKENKKPVLSAFGYLIYFFVEFICYYFTKSLCKTGNVRLYMPTAFLAGAYLSHIIFNKTLAIFCRKVYNMLEKRYEAVKSRIKSVTLKGKYVGRKDKKTNRVVGGNGGFTAVYSFEYNGLSDDSHKKHEEADRRVKSRNIRARSKKRTDGG